MKDIQGTLRRLDEEMARWHQTIKDARNAILQLQETRLTLMGLAEDDEEARMTRDHSNGHIKPVLTLRKNTGESGPKLVEIEGKVNDEDDKRAKKLARQKKWREDAKKRREKEAGGVVRADDQKGLHPGSAVEDMRSRILTLLKATGDLKRVEIGDKLGLPRGEKNRKAMSNAVYSLLKRGQLKQDFAGRFALSK
jgi:hypothetical protein